MTNIFQGDGYTISYKTYGDRNNDTIVLLPPGIGNSAHFDKFVNVFSQNFFIIAVDLPGMNKSIAKKNSIKYISKNLADFLIDINVSTPILIGESYGGSIAVLMSEILKPKKVILIATGEYFKLWQKIFFTIIFFPARFSKIVRRIYATLIIKLDLFILSSFTNSQLKTIGQRWDEIIWFSLPKQFTCNSPTLIVKSDEDKIIRHDSLKKLEKIFPNNNLIVLHCNHFQYLKNLQDFYFNQIKLFLGNIH